MRDKDPKKKALWNLMFPEGTRPDIPGVELGSPSEFVPPVEEVKQPEPKPSNGMDKLYELILGQKGIEPASEPCPEEDKMSDPLKKKDDEDDEDEDY